MADEMVPASVVSPLKRKPQLSAEDITQRSSVRRLGFVSEFAGASDGHVEYTEDSSFLDCRNCGVCNIVPCAFNRIWDRAAVRVTLGSASTGAQVSSLSPLLVAAARGDEAVVAALVLNTDARECTPPWGHGAAAVAALAEPRAGVQLDTQNTCTATRACAVAPDVLGVAVAAWREVSPVELGPMALAAARGASGCVALMAQRVAQRLVDCSAPAHGATASQQHACNIGCLRTDVAEALLSVAGVRTEPGPTPAAHACTLRLCLGLYVALLAAALAAQPTCVRVMCEATGPLLLATHWAVQMQLLRARGLCALGYVRARAEANAAGDRRWRSDVRVGVPVTTLPLALRLPFLAHAPVLACARSGCVDSLVLMRALDHRLAAQARTAALHGDAELMQLPPATRLAAEVSKGRAGAGAGEPCPALLHGHVALVALPALGGGAPVRFAVEVATAAAVGAVFARVSFLRELLLPADKLNGAREEEEKEERRTAALLDMLAGRAQAAQHAGATYTTMSSHTRAGTAYPARGEPLLCAAEKPGAGVVARSVPLTLRWTWGRQARLRLGAHGARGEGEVECVWGEWLDDSTDRQPTGTPAPGPADVLAGALLGAGAEHGWALAAASVRHAAREHSLATCDHDRSGTRASALVLSTRVGASARAVEGGGDGDGRVCSCGVLCVCAGDTARALLAAVGRAQGCAREEAGVAVEEAARTCEPAVMCAVLGAQGLCVRASALATTGAHAVADAAAAGVAGAHAELSIARAATQSVTAVCPRALAAWGTWCGEACLLRGGEMSAAAMVGARAGMAGDLLWAAAARLLASSSASAAAPAPVRGTGALAARVLTVVAEALERQAQAMQHHASPAHAQASWAARALLCVASAETLGGTGGAVAVGAEWGAVAPLASATDIPVAEVDGRQQLRVPSTVVADRVAELAATGWAGPPSSWRALRAQASTRLSVGAWAALCGPVVLAAATGTHRERWVHAGDVSVALVAATLGARAEAAWAVLSGNGASTHECVRGEEPVVMAARLGLASAVAQLHAWGARLEWSAACERAHGEEDVSWGGGASSGSAWSGWSHTTSALAAAARAGHTPVVRLLLRLGADADGMCVRQGDEGDWLARGVLPRTRDTWALWEAVKHGHLDTAVALVESGAATVWAVDGSVVTLAMVCTAVAKCDEMLAALLPIVQRVGWRVKTVTR